MMDFLTGKRRPPAATVLVVEDDPAVRAVIKRGLERAGYDVLEETGEKPVDFQALPRVDVLVADVGLPAETGDDVAERCIQRWPHCEVILLTGHEPDELRKRGVRSDLEVVQKPVLPRTVADLVYKRLTLRGWRALRTDQDQL